MMSMSGAMSGASRAAPAAVALPTYGLEVTIVQGINLSNQDNMMTGTSDPYVTCTIKPAHPDKKEKPHQIQTAVINNNLNPVWNHHEIMHGFHEGDSLEFAVWDKDSVSSTAMGSATLHSQDFFPQGIEGQIQLTGKNGKGAIVVRVVPVDDATHEPAPQQIVPQQQAAGVPRANQQQHTLQVTVIRATNLKNTDAMLTKKTDPYCIVQVPGQSHMSFQTPVVSDNLNPVWNHCGQIKGFRFGDALEFQVWDKDGFPKPDSIVGTVTLSADDLATNPHGLEGTLPFQGAGAQGEIEVRVEILGEHAPPLQPAINQPTMHIQEPNYQHDTKSVKMQCEIIQAVGLKNVESGLQAGKSDPYCICHVPGDKKRQFQTPVVQNNLNPVWNHKGEIPKFNVGHVGGEPLEFEVWDKNSFPLPDKLVAKARLSPADMANNPHGLEAELPLADDKGMEAGTLLVRVFFDHSDAHGQPSAGHVPGGQAVPGPNQSGQYQPGQAVPGGTVHPGQYNPGQQQPGQVHPGQYQPGQQQPGNYQPGQGVPGSQVVHDAYQPGNPNALYWSGEKPTIPQNEGNIQIGQPYAGGVLTAVNWGPLTPNQPYGGMPQPTLFPSYSGVPQPTIQTHNAPQPAMQTYSQPVMSQPVVQSMAVPRPIMQTTSQPVVQKVSSQPVFQAQAVPQPMMSQPMVTTVAPQYYGQPGVQYYGQPGTQTFPGASPSVASQFDMIDRNHDGAISRAEFNASIFTR